MNHKTDITEIILDILTCVAVLVVIYYVTSPVWEFTAVSTIVAGILMFQKYLAGDDF